MSLDVTLLDALCGWQKTITSICGKPIKVQHQGPTPVQWVEAFAGLGMCSHKNQNQRGDLIVGINIKYPGSLNDRQRMLLKEALGGR
jgi:DnaJ family protein B protein 4